VVLLCIESRNKKEVTMYSSKVIQEFEISVNNNIRKLDAKEEFLVQKKNFWCKTRSFDGNFNQI
jgi:hypothetical protein